MFFFINFGFFFNIEFVIGFKYMMVIIVVVVFWWIWREFQFMAVWQYRSILGM